MLLGEVMKWQQCIVSCVTQGVIPWLVRTLDRGVPSTSTAAMRVLETLILEGYDGNAEFCVERSLRMQYMCNAGLLPALVSILNSLAEDLDEDDQCELLRKTLALLLLFFCLLPEPAVVSNFQALGGIESLVTVETNGKKIEGKQATDALQILSGHSKEMKLRVQGARNCVVRERMAQERDRISKRMADSKEARVAVNVDAHFPERPAEHMCPISAEYMLNPVLAADGQAYERVEIERWLKDNDTSPLTNEKMDTKTLVPCHALKAMIAEWDIREHARCMALAGKLQVPTKKKRKVVE